MLEMRAIVIKLQGEEALVQPLGTGGCGHCDSEGGCGSGTLTKMFCSSKPRHFAVRNQVRAKVGDEVHVTLPDGTLFRGAVKMYILPLILLLAGGGFGVSLAGDAVSRDAYAAAGAVSGLLLGFILARLSSFRVGQAVASSIVTSRFGS
ncbi:MAG: SoxR reducing system RseC family protein [Nitrosomonadales bacterium]|nr:SoxR reducing system RseC family protein [Nitrosomonadales bacterium]